ncbi:MAG: hypothetical protein HZA02_06565 [Nitrospinae bacterium]|nr:hypothetical protein [Nitrospinota bacterium]
MSDIKEEQKPFVTVKSVSWFIIASMVCIGYYVMIDIGLMKVQGLDFFYLWTSGK